VNVTNYVHVFRFIQLVTHFCYMMFDYKDVHTGTRNKGRFSLNISKQAVALKKHVQHSQSECQKILLTCIRWAAIAQSV
jgi:hypothetical protein